jgi:N-methylhydantoinase B
MTATESQPPSAGTLDFLTAEIAWHRLISVVEEAEAVIAHMSFSPVVGEARDYAAALLDGSAEVIAQSPSGIGTFVAILGRAARRVLEIVPKGTLQPGDVVITNDPWVCAGHLPDVMTLTPIFSGERIIAYATSIAHMSDLGGQISASARDLFEEGLRIWPCHLYRAGVENEDVFRFIRSNSRSPQQVVGDLQAQVAATKLMGRQVLEALEEHGLPDLDELSVEIHGRAERAVRELIERVPDGSYRGELVCDGIDEDITMIATVTVTSDELHVDWDGTSEQVRGGLNCPFTMSLSETAYALRIALGGSDLPLVEGAVRPITVSAPEGSILNPRFPAPVMIRVATAHNIAATVFRALEPLAPEYIDPSAISAHYGSCWTFAFRGLDAPTDTNFARGGPPQMSGDFVQLYLFNGGTGATGVGDGANALSMPVNCANVPIEVMEARSPFLFERKELMPGSGGAGRFRGGLGQRVVVRNLADGALDFIPRSCGRIQHPPLGLRGGEPGSGGAITIDGEDVNYRQAHRLGPGQVVIVSVPGGGGFGDPADRPAADALTDIEAGYVTPAPSAAVPRPPTASPEAA